MFNLVFFEPEIPPNTGNATRLCSNTGSRLHLIKPLGFSLGDKQLRRAGLDYLEYSEIRTHESWQEFLETCAPERIFAFSTKAESVHSEAEYKPDDYFLFGPETRGLPDEIRNAKEIDRELKIPMMPGSRSLNLSNAAAVVIYEAWRQNGFNVE
jgi:tRNA (cytidine/uridine-2'-O-)-methyltransferase